MLSDMKRIANNEAKTPNRMPTPFPIRFIIFSFLSHSKKFSDCRKELRIATLPVSWFASSEAKDETVFIRSGIYELTEISDRHKPSFARPWNPPKMFIVCPFRIRVHRRGCNDPALRDNLFPVPIAAVDIKATKLGEVNRAGIETT